MADCLARNLEVKVRCGAAGLRAVRERAAVAGLGPFHRCRQVDAYFNVAHGRLKLRVITSDDGQRSAELIAYARPDRVGMRWSVYRRVPIAIEQAAALRDALATTAGIAAVVDKAREVAVYGRTRIHLDTVRDLGEFVEVETVADGLGDGLATAELERIVALLGLSAYETIAGSYADLATATRRPAGDDAPGSG
jgi:adenylate cyclase class IV